MMRETSRSGQKRILAAFDVRASLVHARCNAGNRGVIPGDGGKRQPCVGKARRGGAGFGEPSQTAPKVSEKLLRVHSEKGVLTRDPGGSESKPFRTSVPALFKRVLSPDDGGKGCGGWCSSILAPDQASDDTVEHVEKGGKVTHSWLEPWA